MSPLPSSSSTTASTRQDPRRCARRDPPRSVPHREHLPVAKFDNTRIPTTRYRRGNYKNDHAEFDPDYFDPYRIDKFFTDKYHYRVAPLPRAVNPEDWRPVEFGIDPEDDAFAVPPRLLRLPRLRNVNDSERERLLPRRRLLRLRPRRSTSTTFSTSSTSSSPATSTSSSTSRRSPLSTRVPPNPKPLYLYALFYKCHLSYNLPYHHVALHSCGLWVISDHLIINYGMCWGASFKLCPIPFNIV